MPRPQPGEVRVYTVREYWVVEVGRSSRVRRISLTADEAYTLLWMLSKEVGIPWKPRKPRPENPSKQAGLKSSATMPLAGCPGSRAECGATL
jgi:hypothetical protein